MGTSWLMECVAMVFFGSMSVVVTIGILVNECKLNCVSVSSINIVDNDFLGDAKIVEVIDCLSESVGEKLSCEELTWSEPVTDGCVLRYVVEMSAGNSV